MPAVSLPMRVGPLALLILASLPAPTHGGPASPFTWDGRCLRVVTQSVEITFEEGRITALASRATHEAFTQAAATTEQSQIDLRGMSPANDLSSHLSAVGRQPGRTPPRGSRRVPGAGSSWQFHQSGTVAAEVSVQKLEGGAPGEQLVYRFQIDARTGELLLSVEARTIEPSVSPQVLDLPVVNLVAPAIVLGCGARYVRGDPVQWDACTRHANNLYGPRIVVLEGAKGTLALWTEQACDPGNLLLIHGEKSDQVVIHAERDAREKDPRRLCSITWRLGAFPHWCDAARRYREMFQESTGARPLWDYHVAWARQIHAVSTEIPPAKDAAKHYARLAERIDPARLLLFYWNGSGLILFGDHRYMPKLARPQPEVLAALKQHGFRWMGYHPYNLVFAPHAMAPRMEQCAAKWGLPEGYRFTPDASVPAGKFPEAFRPIATGYYRGLDEAQLWVLHPAAAATREYLVRNFGGYCAFQKMDGAYLDTMGADHESMFPADKRMVAGVDYRRGERQALADLARGCPQLALMSEIQSEWSVAATFFTWEGSSHFQLPLAHPSIKTKVNHPLRTAVWGRYAWTREEGIEPDESALIGGLPTLNSSDDWSWARAELFAGEELYNDLPPKWDDAALAYYRGKGDRWFQYRRMPWGEAYVEPAAGDLKVRLGVLKGQTRGTLEQPIHIQDWPAYREGRPIGLDPTRAYPFVLGGDRQERLLTITQLPDGVFVRSVRPCPNYSVVEFGRSQDGSGQPATIGIRLHRPCVRISDGMVDQGDGLAVDRECTRSTAIPGALVFVWQETKPRDLSKGLSTPHGTGRFLARGTPDATWCYNSHLYNTRRKLGARELPTTVVGPGRFRGCADTWVEVPDRADVAVTFQLGYSLAEGNKGPIRPVDADVQINGNSVWSERLASPVPDWQPRRVSLAAYRGRKVLLTLSAQVGDDPRRHPSHLDSPVLFGDMHW